LRKRLNELGCARTPCFFFLGFDAEKSFVAPLDGLDESVLFDIDGFANFDHSERSKKSNITSKTPTSFEEYSLKFDEVIRQIQAGNTYILNLTAPTKIEIDSSLYDVFHSSKAKFRLLLDERLVVFSPERFVSIDGAVISTYPMKGTCAFDEEALEALLASKKEHAEHTMVVDLLRNDLSMVAQNVALKSFREAVSIEAGGKRLYQTVSHIEGDLTGDWHERLGDILCAITPAGSISGAPKLSSLGVIKQVEGYERGYFSGVFGYFDGSKLDSAVAIRYIEKIGDEYIYKSGGGVTLDSDARAEYEEMIAKVYIPSV
jgi:para-aminobenzoate synthetase component I